MHWTSNEGTTHILSTESITWRIYTRAPNLRMNGEDELSSFTMTNPTQGHGDANNTRISADLTQAFAEGDALMISMQWPTTGPAHSADRMYVTVVVELDWDTVSY